MALPRFVLISGANWASSTTRRIMRSSPMSQSARSRAAAALPLGFGLTGVSAAGASFLPAPTAKELNPTKTATIASIRIFIASSLFQLSPSPHDQQCDGQHLKHDRKQQIHLPIGSFAK